MTKGLFATITALLLIATATTGCTGALALPMAPDEPAPGTNFRLLVSDEPNDIGDFEELSVTITGIGVRQKGESGGWTEYEIDPAETVDLTELQGTSATEVWSGELADGEYTKVFIYVSEVTGILADADADGEATVKLPSGKLQISAPFEVSEGQVAEFVFDITVIKAGRSGKYILKPQIAESGPDQEFEETESAGKPEDAGKPDDVGKPEDAGKPEGAGEPQEEGDPEE